MATPTKPIISYKNPEQEILKIDVSNLKTRLSFFFWLLGRFFTPKLIVFTPKVPCVRPDSKLEKKENYSNADIRQSN